MTSQSFVYRELTERVIIVSVIVIVFIGHDFHRRQIAMPSIIVLERTRDLVS